MIEKKQKTLALFDLDGTLTHRDTFLELIRFFFGTFQLWLGLLLLSPWLTLYKMGVIPNWSAKEKVFSYFFKGMPLDRFQEECNKFAKVRLPTLFKDGALQTIERLKNNGAKIIIVSASGEHWIKPWCELVGCGCIATRFERREGKLTGKMDGKNCYGIEKVNRIREWIDLSQFDEILAYGDSKGDLPMLGLATKAYFKTFD